MAEPIVHTLSMSSPPDDVDSVHALLESVWADVPAVPIMDRFRFETALVELTSNVIRHASDESGVSCTLRVETAADRISAVLSDTGLPGHVELVGRDMPDELAESGRGIPLIQALVDELSYDRAGERNEWRISRVLGS